MRRPFERFRGIVLLAPALLAATMLARASDPHGARAQLIAKFPQFVEWPHAAPPRATFDFCVAGPHPLRETIEGMITGQAIRGRAMRVHDVPRDLDECEVLYVPHRTRAGRRLLDRAADRPILTIGEAPGFIQSGGIIEFAVVEGQLVFEVNLTQAREVKLRMSSQLLRLARQVHGGGPP